MISGTIEVFDAPARRKLARASLVLGEDAGALLKRYTGPAVLDLMKTFPPMVSVSGKDSFAAQRRVAVSSNGVPGSIARDIGRVYDSITQVYQEVYDRTADADMADAFYRAAKRGDEFEAREILRRAGLFARVRSELGAMDASHHRHARSPRTGRVRAGREARLLVTNPAQLRRYVRLIEKRAGSLKAGFLAGYHAAGGNRTIPSWITRHARKGRGSDLSARKRDPVIIVQNTVNYAATQDRRGGLVAISVARSRERILRGVQATVRRKLRSVR